MIIKAIKKYLTERYTPLQKLKWVCSDCDKTNERVYKMEYSVDLCDCGKGKIGGGDVVLEALIKYSEKSKWEVLYKK